MENGGWEVSNRPTVTSLRIYLLTGDAQGVGLSCEAGTAFWGLIQLPGTLERMLTKYLLMNM